MKIIKTETTIIFSQKELDALIALLGATAPGERAAQFGMSLDQSATISYLYNALTQK